MLRFVMEMLAGMVALQAYGAGEVGGPRRRGDWHGGVVLGF